MTEAQDHAQVKAESGGKYFLKEIVPRGLTLLEMPSGDRELPDKFSDNEKVGRYVGGGVNLGVALPNLTGNPSNTAVGSLVRMKASRGTAAGDIPVNDKLGEDARITLTDAKGRPFNSRVNPFWLYCIPGQLSLVKEYLNSSAAAEIKDDIRSQDQAELAALHIPTAPKILCDAAFEDKGLLLRGGFLRDNMILYGSLVSYGFFAYEKFDWDEELIGILQGFREKHPHDILPMGVIQVGLLNFWLESYGSKSSSRYTLWESLSLAEYLVYFFVCLVRAVAMGTLFIDDPLDFAIAAKEADQNLAQRCRGLDWKIHDDSIDAQRCFELLKKPFPMPVCRILTSDLEGARQPRIDPECDVLNEIWLGWGLPSAREDAIRYTVQLIGNLRQHGAGRLLDLKAKRHFVLMPMSAKEPWDTSPIEVFEDGAPDAKTIKRLEKAHQARIYQFPDEEDEPFETSRKRTRAMLREQEDQLPHRKRQRVTRQVPGWDELSEPVKTLVKQSRMENTSPDELTEAANFLRRVDGFEHGFRAGSRPSGN